MKVPKHIETKRLILRHQLENDEASFINFMCDSESTQFLSFSDEQKTKEGAKALLGDTVSSCDSESPLFILTAEDKESKTYVGVCGLHPLADDKEIEIFYTVASDQRARGFATEMTQALVQYLKINHEFKQVIAFIMQANANAQKVALSSGFQNHGLVAHEDFNDKVFKYAYDLG